MRVLVFALGLMLSASGYCEEPDAPKSLSSDENRRYAYNDYEIQKKPGAVPKTVRTHYVFTGVEGDEKVDRMWGHLTPDEKCTNLDKRIVHFCLERRFFDPSARVYFDSGTDDEGEIDIFNDGGLNPTIEFAAIHLPWRFGHGEYYDDWSWGPIAGVGISAPPDDPGGDNGSTAPVVMISYGVMLEHQLSEGGASFALEIGGATGFSSDESLDDSTDTAVYVGLKFNIPMGKQEEKKIKAKDDDKFQEALAEFRAKRR